MVHGVIWGDLAVGEPAAPKNIPVPAQRHKQWI